jgi:hypothetical protein
MRGRFDTRQFRDADRTQLRDLVARSAADPERSARAGAPRHGPYVQQPLFVEAAS